MVSPVAKNATSRDDQVPLGVAEPLQVLEVGVQVDLLDGPGVLDGVAVAVVEVRVAHRPQGEVHPRVEEHPGGARVGRGAVVVVWVGRGHWQASQFSGFSREHASASSSRRGLAGGMTAAGSLTDVVVCWMRVAGRERR